MPNNHSVTLQKSLNEHSRFIGPIFIVGMPRSGTKLLRSILNNHSLIAIPSYESDVIPHFYKKIHKYGDFSRAANFKNFYADFSKTNFFLRIRGKIPIDQAVWYNAVQDWSYAGILEAFYRSYTKSQNKIIWGDKTPSYILHLPLLKSLFPSSRFIHIIRDVRDYCLSMKKAWGKNVYRAAQRWYDSIQQCRQDAAAFRCQDYLEIKYEDLLDSPEAIMKSACNFLTIPYEENMIKLVRPTENLGDAKNHVGILQKNYGKWANYLSAASVNKIEGFCSPLLSELGYVHSHKGAARRLGKVEMFLYTMLDGFNLMRFQLNGASPK